MYSGLTLTTTIPARNAPNMATGYCKRLGIINATRSPGFNLATFCSHAAKARLASPSCRNVITVPIELKAGRWAKRSQLTVSTSFREANLWMSISAGTPTGY